MKLAFDQPTRSQLDHRLVASRAHALHPAANLFGTAMVPVVPAEKTPNALDQVLHHGLPAMFAAAPRERIARHQFGAM
jgi:hypothetical protein